ncbi:hypothetical protein HELRODRAFT_103993 [Helobdella robusta]|uniref:Glycerol-3-phosphate dehydrogenase [NAD(+)] n=1 Tax=Helobdella robusta TaxID=6412 RepID=T1EDJ1_HELRO|nr:hypothetical protein HELRODRAFT_103993 [Helobdella robusta]ESN92147.1 hypothetical protein HELRODRAFT_103993 [Helobdella robusta]
MPAKKVCIVGSGNWGMAIAKVIGENVVANGKFQHSVPMYVYEELIDGKKLTEIINTDHENVKYLPGHRIPDNIVADPDLLHVVENADVIVFVTPHQFVYSICKTLKGKVKKSAICVSLIKGLDMHEGNLDLISNIVRRDLEIPCAVLMGANIAGEVASGLFCEATIGCDDAVLGNLLKDLFHRPYFRVAVVQDEDTVELCGALKNIVGVGAGIVDGLGCGGNTKAAVIRLGLLEIVQFCNTFFKKARTETFLESCGFADLVTTCYCGRNRKVAEAFVLSAGQKTIEELEEELLNGQKLQGPPTAAEVYKFLKGKNMLHDFPLFTCIHEICIGKMKPGDFIECLKNHS